MLIVYASKTGNVKRFVQKLNQFDSCPIEKYDMSLGFYILIASTTGFGQVPENVQEFLAHYHSNMVAVAVSGNRVWGSNFGKAGDLISQKYSVPLLLKFELSGTTRDVLELTERIEGIGR